MGITFEDILFRCNQLARMKKKIKNDLTDDDLKKIISRVVSDIREDLPTFSIDEEIVFKQLQKAFVTFEKLDSSILSDEYQPWLKYKNEEDIDWKYWKRYREYLFMKNWSISDVDQIDDDTNEILDRLWDPEKKGNLDQWDRRGMVVGNVQSGKTANFTGLICKATDAGFKVIIVLAGLHDSLRIQTQRRLDEEFVGYESNLGELERKYIGVGEFFPFDTQKNIVDSITTKANNGDFNRTVANNFNRHMSDNPILLVVKKNGPVLKNLLKWLRNTAQMDSEGNKFHTGYPLLVIDDEADNGSVDTGEQTFDEFGNPNKDYDPKTINRSIRQILKIFKQSAYVAYTATPQANIFIHDKGETIKEGRDLYPRHFIVTIEPSPNYFGPKTVFGDENSDGMDLVREIDDFATWMPNKHKIGHIPAYNNDKDSLPPSLKQAIHGFFLVTAARIARGQINKHHSMLVHVTRFTGVQNKVKDKIDKYVKTFLLNTIQNPNSPSRASIVDEMKTLWEADYKAVTGDINDPECPVLDWEKLLPHLSEIIRLTEIREINGSAKDVLDYETHWEKGLITIAVGGDKLSRGLTLEGLNTSYYLRATNMYDTLMQMGRWFGYRPGYYDLCRLYISEELKKHYRRITLADIDLREQFRYMKAIGATPKNFGLKVQLYPDLLATSKVKMRSATKQKMSLAASREETLAFHRNTEKTIRNFTSLKVFLNQITNCRVKDDLKNRVLFKNVPASKVIEYIEDYITPESTGFKKNKISDYILKQNQRNYLTNWTVYIAQGDEDKPHLTFNINENERLLMTIRSTSKKAIESNTEETYYPGILVNRGDETVDIIKGTDVYEKALKITKKAAGEKGKTVTVPDDISARFSRIPENGLLLVYPVYPRFNDKVPLPENTPNIPMIGLAVSFPENPYDEKDEYMVDRKYYDLDETYD